MASRNQEIQDNNGETGTPDPYETTDFFEAEISRYSAHLEADPEETYQRYGFTLYHSLPPEQMVLENQKLGFFRGDAIDTYNLAGIEIGKENYEEAAKMLESALKMDDSLADAVHNLALCYEKLDRKADAIKLWEKYIELIADDEDIEEEERAPIVAHLAELQQA